jgi:hypothetical protein
MYIGLLTEKKCAKSAKKKPLEKARITIEDAPTIKQVQEAFEVCCLHSGWTFSHS